MACAVADLRTRPRQVLAQPPARFVRLSALVLIAALAFGILAISASGAWAVSIFDGVVFALGAVWAVRLVLQPIALEGSPLVAALAWAAAWPLVQLWAGTSVDRFETGNAALVWTAYLTIFVLALQLFGDVTRLNSFLDALLWFATAIAAVSLVQLFTSGGRIFWLFPTPYQDLVLGPFIYRNSYAAFIELAVPLALLKGLARPRNGFLWLAAAALMAASVVASGSRAGTVLVALEIVVVLALAGRRAPGAVWKLGAATAILLAIAGPGYLLSRFKEPDPLSVRREFVQSSIAMLRERPWLGFGLGTWPTAYPAYATIDTGAFANHAHCDWAEWAAEGGLPFVAVTAALASAAVFCSARRRWGIGVVAVFLHAFVDYPLQEPALAALTFALLGALAASDVAPDSSRGAPATPVAEPASV